MRRLIQEWDDNVNEVDVIVRHSFINEDNELILGGVSIRYDDGLEHQVPWNYLQSITIKELES